MTGISGRVQSEHGQTELGHVGERESKREEQLTKRATWTERLAWPKWLSYTGARGTGEEKPSPKLGWRVQGRGQAMPYL